MKLASVIIVTLFAIFFQSCDATDPGKDNNIVTDTTSHIFNWQIDTVGIAPSILSDIWGANENNIYAVGFVYFSFSPYKASNIVHWDGSKWSAINYLEGDLNTIYGFDEKDIWTAGFGRVDNNVYALIAHWNGKWWDTWRLKEYPQISALWGTSSNNIYAVGSNGTILHFNGSVWQKIESGTSLYLTNIFGFENGHFFVCGGSIETNTGILLKYNGTTIEKVIERSYIKDSLSGIMTGIWGSDENNLYVSCDGGLFFSKEGSWSKLSVPNDHTLIRNIRGNDSNNLFIPGSFGMILHFNGNSWHRYDEFYRKPGGDKLYNAWVKEKKVFIVGMSENSRGIIYRGTQ